MIAALQPSLPALRDTPKGFEPLLNRGAVLARIIDRFDKQFADDLLRDYMESDYLNPVFDISVRGRATGEGEQAEWRFFSPAVDQFIAWLINPKTPWRTWPLTDVVARLCPKSCGMRVLGGTAVTSPILQMILGCETKTILRLIGAGHLRQLGEYRQGHGGEAVIEFRSLEAFLIQRSSAKTP